MPPPAGVDAERGEQQAPAAAAVASGCISMGMIANTVPSFSGKENVREYFEKLKIRSRLESWTEKTTIDLIKYRLTGEAYQFLKAESTLQTADITYADFEASFIKKFEPILIPGEPLIKLGRCIQKHDETVAQYVTRLKVIGAEILRTDLAKAADIEKRGLEKKCSELVLNQFKLGLRRELMRQLGPVLMRTDNLTIEKAEEYARQEELNEGMIKNRHALMVMSLDSSTSCNHCGGPNHLARDCLLRSSQENQERPGRSYQNRTPNNASRFRQNYRPNEGYFNRWNNPRNADPNRRYYSPPTHPTQPRYQFQGNSQSSRGSRPTTTAYRPPAPRVSTSTQQLPAHRNANTTGHLNANTPSFVPRLEGQ